MVELCERAVAFYRTDSDDRRLGVGLCDLGEILTLAGNLDQADVALVEAYQLLSDLTATDEPGAELQDGFTTARAAVYLARLRIAQGNFAIDGPCDRLLHHAK